MTKLEAEARKAFEEGCRAWEARIRFLMGGKPIFPENSSENSTDRTPETS